MACLIRVCGPVGHTRLTRRFYAAFNIESVQNLILNQHMVNISARQNSQQRTLHQDVSFEAQWTSDHFFVDLNASPTCFICKENVAVLKEYHIKQHYSTKHAELNARCEGEGEQKTSCSVSQRSVYAENFFSQQ